MLSCNGVKKQIESECCAMACKTKDAGLPQRKCVCFWDICHNDDLRIICECDKLTVEWDIDADTVVIRKITPTCKFCYPQSFPVIDTRVTSARTATFSDLEAGTYCAEILKNGNCVARKCCKLPNAPEGCLTEVSDLVATSEASGRAVNATWKDVPSCGYMAYLIEGDSVIRSKRTAESQVRFDYLVPETRYCVRVRTVCPPFGYGPESEEYCFTTPEPAQCPTTERLNLKLLTGDGKLGASWLRGPYVYYHVRVVRMAEINEEEETILNDTNFRENFLNLDALVSYSYCVYVTGYCVPGGASDEESECVYLIPGCPLKLDLTAGRLVGGTVKSSWKKGFTMYEVELRANDSAGPVIRPRIQTTQTQITYYDVPSGPVCVYVKGICATGQNVDDFCCLGNCVADSTAVVLDTLCPDSVEVRFSTKSGARILYTITPLRQPASTAEGVVFPDEFDKGKVIAGLTQGMDYNLHYLAVCHNGSLSNIQHDIPFTTKVCDQCPDCGDIELGLNFSNVDEKSIDVEWTIKYNNVLIDEKCLTDLSDIKLVLKSTIPNIDPVIVPVNPPARNGQHTFREEDGVSGGTAYEVCLQLKCRGQPLEQCKTVTTLVSLNECQNKELNIVATVEEAGATTFTAYFTWDTDEIIDHFDLVLEDETGNVVLVWSGVGNSFTVTNLDKGLSYTFTLTAVCTDGSTHTEQVVVHFCQYFASDVSAVDNVTHDPGFHDIEVKWCAAKGTPRGGAHACTDDTPGLTGWEIKLESVEGDPAVTTLLKKKTIAPDLRIFYFPKVAAGSDFLVTITALCDDERGRPVVVPVSTGSCPPVVDVRIAGNFWFDPPSLVTDDHFTFWWECPHVKKTVGFTCVLSLCSGFDCEAPPVWSLTKTVNVVQEARNGVTYAKSEWAALAQPTATGVNGSPGGSWFKFCVTANCVGGDSSDERCMTFEYTDCGQRCLSLPNQLYTDAIKVELFWDPVNDLDYPPILKWSWDSDFEASALSDWAISTWWWNGQTYRHSHWTGVRGEFAPNGFPLWPNHYFRFSGPGKYIVRVSRSPDYHRFPCGVTATRALQYPWCENEQGCLEVEVPKFCFDFPDGLWCGEYPFHWSNLPGPPAFPYPPPDNVFQYGWERARKVATYPYPHPLPPSIGTHKVCPISCDNPPSVNCLDW